MARKAPLTGYIAKLTVTLQRIEPSVWRRLLVPANMTLADLHRVIQTVMPWTDDHLHEFDIAGERFGDPSSTGGVVSDRRLTVAGVRNKGVTHFGSTYDFGDNWQHRIVIDGTVPRVAAQHYPACIDGERACPPEDCGGVHGYADLLEAWADPTHPDHEDMSERLAKDFDPEKFALAAVDASLAALFRASATAKR